MITTKFRKTLSVLAVVAAGTISVAAQGWPSDYGGVMLQGFSWDSYSDTQWTKLTSQAAEMDGYIDLLWIPNAGNCGSGNQMGYAPRYWFPVGSNYNSSFGTLSELRTLVSTMRSHHVGIIGDVVINHRQNQSNWTDFVSETYNGVTYRLTASDIVSDDDGGETARHLQSGESLGNADTGDGWSGMRDLDHTSANVQKCVKAYLGALLNDLGYVGFRYDMVAGYAPSYTAVYNNAAQPQFSVGEMWKSGNEIKNWIDGTKSNGTPTSAAFDFQFRYTVRNAINQRNWSKLGDAASGYPLVSSSLSSGSYRRWAVTFVENHDVQDRGNVTNYDKDPIVRDTLAANAYLLAMPGTPCIFQPHWKAYKNELRGMIAVRKAAGVTNTSSYSTVSSSATRYVVTVTGSKANLTCAVGSDLSGYAGPSGTVPVLSGYHYKYFMSTGANIAWVDMPSGSYNEAFDATLTAVSASGTLVYTTDGSTPSATNGTRVASGAKVRVDASMTLKVALLSGGSVVSGSLAERTYQVQQTKKITVYLKNPGWSNVHFYSYGYSEADDTWPGVKVTATKTVRGQTFYYREFESADADFGLMVIFDNGSGGNENQTVDIGPIYSDTYYEISGGGTSSSKFTVTDVTATYSVPLTATVYFKDPGWGTVNYYAWDDNGTLLGNWPGSAITTTTVKDGITYYCHTFEREDESYSFNVIFNDGSGTQTHNIEGITGDVYYKLGALRDGKYDVLDPSAPDPEEPRTATVYFQSPGWGTVNYYAWDDNGTLLGNWPGTAITATTVVNGDTYYYREFTLQDDSYSFNVIFNNGSGTQTHNIEGITGDVYYKLGALRDSKYDVVDLGDPTVSGVTLAEALDGADGVISDELVVARVYGGKVYVTDGEGHWVRLDGVGNTDQMSPGFVIAANQVPAAVTDARRAPAIAVNGELNGHNSDNVPSPRKVILDDAYYVGGQLVMPAAGEVVNVEGFYYVTNGENRLYEYSGLNGSKGLHLLLDTDAGMQQGRVYAVDVVISLVEAWEGAGAGAPRRVSPADPNSYTNLQGTVVGEPAIQTAVEFITADAAVAAVRYVSLDGRVSDRPHDGVNIVVTTLTDGTVRTAKMLK